MLDDGGHPITKLDFPGGKTKAEAAAAASAKDLGCMNGNEGEENTDGSDSSGGGGGSREDGVRKTGKIELINARGIRG